MQAARRGVQRRFAHGANVLEQRTASGESYSYQGQDLFVVEALAGLRGGFFVDSGASDGVNGSNSRLLETGFDWTGICIEPNEVSFETLRRHRSCLCINCCLAGAEGPVDFLEVAGVLGGIIDEYDPGHLQYTRSLLGQQWSDPALPPTIRKQARTLGSVLRECGAPRIIDYWSLDTEGSELTLLKTFPFDEFLFRVLTVEHNITPVRRHIQELLESRGYVLARALGIDDGYVLPQLLPGYRRRSAVWRRPFM